MTTSNPFPPPPGLGPVTSPETPDTRLTDEEMMFIMRSYLRPDQLADMKILKFIFAYMDHRNATQAGKESGVNGTHMRRKPEIHACIEALTTKAVMKYGYDASELIERVKEVAFIDPIEFQNPDGSFKTHMSEIRPEARRAIKKFKAKNIFGADANNMQIVIGQLLEVELWDKLKSFELLGTEKNIFKKTTVMQHDVTTNMANVLLESGKRAEERKLLMSREVRDAQEEETSGDDQTGWNQSEVSESVGGGAEGGD